MTTVATEFEIQQSVVPLEHIYVGDINPRKMPADIAKDKNDPELVELSESIAAQGVIQPVLLRPGKGTHIGTFELVAGQRRFRASILAGKTDIPALIKDMNDEEAREAAIVENLQRKDVEPLEEAEAFSLLAKKGLTAKQVSEKVGKTERYVRTATKLADLLPQFKKSLQAGELPLEDAFNLARFDEKTQKAIFKEHGDTPSDWQYREYHARLDKAPFDISDATLNPSMGPCTTCQFNSQHALLFNEGATGATCLKVDCYNKKFDENIKRKVQQIKEDPTLIPVISGYSDINNKMVAELKKEGINVLNRNHYEPLDPPDMPEMEDFEGNNDTPAEDKKEFEEAVKDYEKEKITYDKLIASDKNQKAIVLEGENAGQTIVVKIKKASAAGAGSSKGTDIKAAQGKLTAEDVQFEADRIRERVKRGKELDAEKVYAKILEATGKHATLKDLKTGMSKLEEAMMYHYLLDKAPHSIRTKLTGGLKLGDSRSNEAYAARLMKLTAGEKAFIVRNVFMQEYGGNYPKMKQAYLRYQWAVECKDVDVKGFEGEQAELRERRENRATERIASLKNKLKEPSKAKEKKKHGKK